MKTQRQEFDLSDIGDFIDQLEAMHNRVLRRAFIAYHLEGNTLEDMPEIRIEVAALSIDRDWLNQVVADDVENPCPCGEDGTCDTAKAAKVALAKLDAQDIRCIN